MATAKKFFETSKNNKGCTIEKYTGTDTVVEIPEEFDGVAVTRIGRYAFKGCTSLTQITIPDSVTSIGEYAFRGCTSLRQITIPEGVKTIEYFTFQRCTSLSQITIPDSVTKIWGAPSRVAPA